MHQHRPNPFQGKPESSVNCNKILMCVKGKDANPYIPPPHCELMSSVLPPSHTSPFKKILFLWLNIFVVISEQSMCLFRHLVSLSLCVCEREGGRGGGEGEREGGWIRTQLQVFSLRRHLPRFLKQSLTGTWSSPVRPRAPPFSSSPML